MTRAESGVRHSTSDTDPPAVLRLVKEPATGGDGRGEARLREVRRHRDLDVDALRWRRRSVSKSSR